METCGDAVDGNTKTSTSRINQLSGWFFTWNNYPDNFLETLETVFKKICVKYIFEKEIGENGTPHIQGCIKLKKAMRWTEFKLPKEIHWEKTRNEESAIKYCEKDALDRNGADCWKFGFPKPIRIIHELLDWQKEAENILTTECTDFSNRELNWWYDYEGKRGKSVFCKYMAVKHKTLVIQGGKLADIMNIIFNTDMDNCKSVIIDVPRANKNAVSYAAIECIMNGMITNTKFETGVKIFNPPTIMVLCNYPPDATNDWVSADRMKIKDITRPEWYGPLIINLE